MPPIYLDHSATTPLDPRVLEAMLPTFGPEFGNAMAIHAQGRAADHAIDTARRTLAGLLGCAPGEIVFTSGGTESDNLALRGVAYAAHAEDRPLTLITTPVEHPAIAATARHVAAAMGAGLRIVPVDRFGRVDPDDLHAALQTLPPKGLTLVTIIHGSNEIGTINPIAELAAIAHQHGALFHTDAVQSAAQLPIDVGALGVDLLSLSAHKFYGPKGVGALVVRSGTALMPAQTGGSHEEGLRAGTHNTPGIVGLATAFALNREALTDGTAHMVALRDRLIDGVLSAVPESVLTGHPTERLPGHASFAFRHLEANTLLMLLDGQGIAASSGSACQVGRTRPAPVLEAIGLGPDWTRGGLRLTLGLHTRPDEIDTVIALLPDIVERTRRLRTFTAIS